ncbi:hypothetical protein E8Q33_00950 [Methylophaga sp. SB9B]|uniref:hypothetical protein n=1 Tax=Methylophaga sp. SB9B TaxID=2570356 RepID=UPI0010A8B704|nr:hypothetical protein [Methylophaga sp. SB9B]THK43219.1 hypothetical protein E8Q33_00950 [Methylophaga sp. SB9B]
MSLLKTLFIPLFTTILLAGLMVLMPSQTSYADVSVNVQLGQNLHHRPHPGFSGHRHYRHPSAGITGHRSFGLDPRLNRHRYPMYKPHYRHYDTTRPRHRSGYYGYRGSNITIVAPLIYSQSYQTVAPVRSYASSRPNMVTQTNALPRHAIADGWEALSRYESGNAINAFKAQSSKDPQASLPQVGFALATALQGEPEKAVWALDLALKADTRELRYFSADPGLQLVIDDLLDNYQNAPLMTATLLYLKQDYQAADSALQKALNECDNCTGPRNMQHLIRQRISG